MTQIVLTAGPMVFPGGTGNDARVLGAFLIVERNGKLGSGSHLLLEVIGEERSLQTRGTLCQPHRIPM